MGWTESQPTNDKPQHGEEKHDTSHSLLGDIWSAVEHQTGISTVKALLHTETAENYLHDFKIVDDGKHSFNQAAREHIEKSLNGQQMNHLGEERSSYNWKLGFSAVPIFFAPDAPEKGTLMKQFDQQTDSMVKAAEERVQRNMTGDEMKKYRDEVDSYRNWQIAAAAMPVVGLVKHLEPGPMMKEYEKRVLAEIDKSSISWTEKRNDGR